MKEFIVGIYKSLSAFFMWLPFIYIRKLFLKICGMKFGKHTYFSRNLDIRVPYNIRIGNNVIINKRVLLDGRCEKITIGNNVDIAQDVKIWTLEHNTEDNTHGLKYGEVTIGDNVWIASNVTILPGVNIGKGAVIATGAVVTKDVPEKEIWGGCPAKFIKRRDNDCTYILKYRTWFE